MNFNKTFLRIIDIIIIMRKTEQMTAMGNALRRKIFS